MSRKPGPEVRAVRLPLGEDAVRPTFRRERAALKRGVWPVAVHYDDLGAGLGEIPPGLLPPDLSA